MDLKIGDTIQCADKDDLLDNMIGYQEAGVQTDFLYKKNGVDGFWLIVTGFDDGGRKEI